MMRPDGTWRCPICVDSGPLTQPTCWHLVAGGDIERAKGAYGCSTWYAGRLLHFTKQEVELLRKLHKADLPAIELDYHLIELGFARVNSQCREFELTAEGENLCRHLWGLPQ